MAPVVPVLLEIASTHADADARARALFWLGESGDPRPRAIRSVAARLGRGSPKLVPGANVRIVNGTRPLRVRTTTSDGSAPMYSEHDPASGFAGESMPPRDPAASSSAANEPEPPGEPRIRATLHERTKWKQLFKDAVTLTLDTLDEAGDRMRKDLRLDTPPAPKTDDAA